MLSFERGDRAAPKGHALLLFQDPADQAKVFATYVVVLPVALDVVKYMPPFLASHASELVAKGLSAFAFPPVPEAAESVERLKQLAAARDDDLLLGGAADYLALSALLGGLVAGLFLGRAGGPARDAISRDLLQFHRPLVALVLLVAGARVDLPLAWAGAGITFVLIRTAAKLAGGWTAARIAGTTAPRRLGLDLLSPGVLGLAFALNALRANSADGALVLAVATVGMVGSELLAALVRPVEASS